MSIDSESLKELRAIPAFREYADRKMASDAAFWRHEAARGTGLMQAAAVAVVAIGSDDV